MDHQLEIPLTPLEILASQYLQLERQMAEIKAKMDILVIEGRAQNLAEIRIIMAENGLTQADLFGGVPTKSAKSNVGGRGTVAAKYRDQAGNSWSGRGLTPRWLKAALAQGAKIEDYKI